MEVLLNKKARIILKEGTGAMIEYGKNMLGYIKDLTDASTEGVKNLYYSYTPKILLFEDDYGEKSLIPLEDVENILYIK